MSQGKGSTRRPCLVNKDEYDARWRETFSKKPCRHKWVYDDATYEIVCEYCGAAVTKGLKKLDA
jgi:hypothetical protein